MTTSSSLAVLVGTSVLSVVQFTVPTLAAFPTVTKVATTPATVALSWAFQGEAKTTWTYGVGSHITKLGTGLYVATITTKTAPSSQIIGTWTGTGNCTVQVQFTLDVTPLTT